MHRYLQGQWRTKTKAVPASALKQSASFPSSFLAVLYRCDLSLGALTSGSSMPCCNSALRFFAVFMSRKPFSVSEFWFTTYKCCKHAAARQYYTRISAPEITPRAALPRAIKLETPASWGHLVGGGAKSDGRSTQRPQHFFFPTEVSKEPFHGRTQAFFLQEHWFQMVLDNK